MDKRTETEGQETKWPKKRDRCTSNTKTKVKWTEGQTTQWLLFLLAIVLLVLLSVFFLAIVLLVLLSLFFGHCVACPSVIFFGTEGQATQ
jgi:uncharacterized integral membrane protein